MKAAAMAAVPLMAAALVFVEEVVMFVARVMLVARVVLPAKAAWPVLTFGFGLFVLFANWYVSIYRTSQYAFAKASGDLAT